MELRKPRACAAIVVLGICGLLLAAAQSTEARGASRSSLAEPWRDTSQPPLQRANELLAALSFDQKVALALGDFSALASFGVPPLTSDDGPSGIRAAGTTAFPSAQTLAATFDESLAHAYGEAIGTEARGKGFNEWLGPAMDIARTPLAGRQPENQGEDPFLAGHTVAAEVAGAKSRHVIATLKHYVGNNQEWGRIGFQIGPSPFVHGPPVNDLVSERALQEIYEAPFRTAAQHGGADAVMCSYNRVNGLQTCESPAVLGDLKTGADFAGFVIPDFGFAVRDPLAATLAGVDVPALGGAGGRTADMFTSGQVPPERLDDIVRRTLYALFDSGAFDDPVPAPADNVSTPAHVELATQVAESGAVLLQNKHEALPLSNVHSVAVIGPAGDDAVFINGGSAAVPTTPGQVVTPLAGIVARAGSAVSVDAAQGSAGDVAAPTIVPASALAPSSGTGPGLLASYWSNGDSSGAPTLTRVDPTVDLPAPPAEVGTFWSARWTGTLRPPESGLYRFSLLEAGIAQLTIDGKPLIPLAYREATQFLFGPLYPLQGTIRLTADHPVSIQIDYSSKSALFGAQIHLAWQLPSGSEIANAVAAARKADAAIVFANDAQGEGMDRVSLALPGDQDELITAVAAANPRTIVVLNTGGPVLMPWLGDVEAVLEAWYPGQQFGAAVAAVLFGDADPGGRLPVTFPASDEQGPAPRSQPQRYPGVGLEEHYDEGLYVGYRWYDRSGQQPLFPFGYGLSYASFRFSDLTVQYDAAKGTVHVTARAANLSQRPGSAVAELYLTDPPGAHEPVRQLKGYQKVHLGPGQSARVSFDLTQTDLAYFDEASSRWLVAPGRYTISVGSSSAVQDLQLRGTFEVRP